MMPKTMKSRALIPATTAIAKSILSVMLSFDLIYLLISLVQLLLMECLGEGIV